jgi:hypothetical protein
VGYLNLFRILPDGTYVPVAGIQCRNAADLQEEYDIGSVDASEPGEEFRVATIASTRIPNPILGKRKYISA